MFKNEGVKPTTKQVMVEPKVSNPLVHMVDVNMAITKSKVIEAHVFKDREQVKKKFIADLEEEQKLQQNFVETIQGMQVEDPPQNLIPKEKTQWSTSWARLPKFEVSIEPIVLKNLSTNLVNRVMSVEQMLQDINKQTLETAYFEGRSIAKDSAKSEKICVVGIEAKKTKYNY
jgi:hypothetical protein